VGTRVLTESLCDRCGLKHVEEGAHGDIPPVAWSLAQLSIRAAGEGWSGGSRKVEWHLCPFCTRAVQNLVAEGASNDETAAAAPRPTAASLSMPPQGPVTISPATAYVEATVRPEPEGSAAETRPNAPQGPPEAIYPYVSCHLHAPAPGYTVCPHVLRGARAGQTVPPTADHVGQILCKTGQCRPQPAPGPDHMTRLVCPACAKEKGWITPGGAAP